MSTENEARYYLDRLKEAWDDPEIDTPLGHAIARLKVPFVLEDGKKWYYERFVSFFSAVRQALAAIDDSISPDLPPFLLEPATIARLFRIPLEDLTWQGGQADRAAPDAQSRMDDKLQVACERLSAIESKLDALGQHHTIKEFYTTADLCRIFGKAPYTVREWCRLGRIRARKVPASCGGECEWRISHEELARIQNEGLLPVATKY
jgi:hypothetical protein